MAETTYFPRRLILAGAMISGVLLALAVHMLGARYGLDLGGLWRSDTRDFMPAGAAIAWWLIATVGFSGGYFTATLMDSAVSGQIPQRMRQFLIAVGVLVLAGAGQAASAPSPIPTISGVLAGLAALCLGAAMAFCGAHFALRKAYSAVRVYRLRRRQSRTPRGCPRGICLKSSTKDQLAARRLTLALQRASSDFLSVAFSSSSVFCSTLAQSPHGQAVFTPAIRLPP